MDYVNAEGKHARFARSNRTTFIVEFYRARPTREIKIKVM